MTESVRLRVRVEGVVQGVGFRPFVHGVAHRLDLVGHVGNDVAGVFIEVEGVQARVDEFLTALRTEAPRLATIDAVTAVPCPPLGASGFAIVASKQGGERSTGITADSATCDDCLRELHDPTNRRHGYPFVNCTNCGPRFTIAIDVPYDRPLTTMAGFAMCDECATEYHDPRDRRFHAQPTCCPACGPRLRLVRANREPVAAALRTGPPVAGEAADAEPVGPDPVGAQPVEDDPIAAAAHMLRAGAIVAVKGLGGYHLAADASSAAATAALRARKHREEKPFAVMVADIETARKLCIVDAASEALLRDRRRPIVLLDRRAGFAAWAQLAAPVAPGNRQIGVMLPYTPVHTLLLAAVGGPLVMTSGNVSDEPIAYDDGDAQARLGQIADAYLTHDRPIHTRVDDSVARAYRGRPMLTRRARGYAPEPLRLHIAAPRPVLACGAELKNTFCLLKQDRAVLSHHIGDLENYATLRAYTEGIEQYQRLFDVRPEVISYDPHPEYLSTKYALDHDDIDLVAVQHHHAHIASCLADNGESGPVIGVAYDGTGYGTDGTIWGGELLIADLVSFERAGHLAPVPLPGGAAAIRAPWRMAVAYLHAAYGAKLPDLALPDLALLRRHADGPVPWTAIAAMARDGVNAPLTSSAGRLFDAVAALLGVRDDITYEGQAAIELEQRADRRETGGYPMAIDDDLVLAGTDLIRATVDDLARGVPVAIIAARFHNGLADATARACGAIRERSGITTVACSGGVFQNLLLLDRVTAALERDGFRVLTHSRVPANDGGISFGQAAVAAARDARNQSDPALICVAGDDHSAGQKVTEAR